MAYTDIVGSTVNIKSGEQYGAPGEGFNISDGGVLNVGYKEGTTILGGGTVYSATIGPNGSMYVLSGAGYSNGGLLLNDIVLDGGVLSGFYKSGSVYDFNGLTVLDGTAYLWCANVMNLSMTGGDVKLQSRGVSGGTLEGGILGIYGGKAFANDLTINGGVLRHSSGTASNTLLLDGEFRATPGASTGTGIVVKDTVVSGGTAVFNLVTKGATNYYSSTSVYDQGTVLIGNGVVDGMNISGGVVSIINPGTQGLTMQGTITIGGSGVLSAAEATSVDDAKALYVFDLTDCEDGREAMIDEFSYTKATDFTIKIDADQKGAYSLASVDSFDKDFTLIVGSENVGQFKVGESLICGDYAYKLSCDMRDLCLEVVESSVGELTISAGSDEIMYDGTSHTVNTYSYIGKLQEGDTMTVTVNGATATDAGHYVTQIASVVIMRSGEDVTDEYQIEKIDGALDITKRAITITTGSAKKQYDGTPLTCDTYTVTGDGFAGSENVSVTVTGSQTAAGESANTFNYSFINGGKAANYDVTKETGTLKVLDGYDDIVGSTVNLTAPETYGDEGMGFAVKDGGILNNGYMDGKTAKTAGVVTSATLSSGGTITAINYTKNATIFKDLVIEGGTFNNGNRKADGTNETEAYVIDGFTMNGGVASGGSGMIRPYIYKFTINGGSIKVWSGAMIGGTINGGDVQIAGGNTILSDSVISGGSFTMGGLTRVANVTMYDGFLNANSKNAKNYTFNGFTLSGGSAAIIGNVWSTGTTWAKTNVNSTIVRGGDLSLFGGQITDVAVSGGSLHFVLGQNGSADTLVSSGAYLSGTIELAAAAKVDLVDGIGTGLNYSFINDSAATWVFNLTDRTVDSTSMMTDMAFSNATGYTITVTDTQASGTYTIVDGASALDGKTFSLKVAVASMDIVVGGETVDNFFGTYTLKLDNGTLKLDLVSKGVSLQPVMLFNKGNVVEAATTWSGAVLDGTTYDQMLITEGGTATDTTVGDTGVFTITAGEANNLIVSGGTVSIEGGIVNDLVVSGGKTTISSGVINGLERKDGGQVSIAGGVVINDIDYVANSAEDLFVSSGTVIDGGTVAANVARSVQVAGIMRNVTLGGVMSGLLVIEGGTAENMTFVSGVQRISGALVNADVYGGGVRTFNNGILAGTINVYAGYTDLAYKNCKISGGTVNLIGSGTYLLLDHSNANAATELTADSVVNASEYTYLGSLAANGATTFFTVNGAINLNGGRIENTILAENTAWTFGNTGSLNFDFSGINASSQAFVRSYNNLNSVSGSAFTVTFTADDTIGYGDFILFGDASSYATRNQTISFSFDGGSPVVMNLGDSIVDAKSCREYTLKQVENNIVVSVTGKGGTAAASAGAITTDDPVTWGASTTYASGAINIGRAEGDVTVFIDNTGASGLDATYVFGGNANGDAAGGATIMFYQGDMGAILGGAADSGKSVGSADVQIGGGTSAATTGVVYGGGFGSVTGDVRVSTYANAVVKGQIFGGSYIYNNSAEIGDVTVNLAGGEIQSDVIGGARMKGNGTITTTVDSVKVKVDGASLTGGENTSIYGAGWVVGNGSKRLDSEVDYEVAGNVTVGIYSDVDCGTGNGRGIFGGALAADYALAQVTGDVKITIEDAVVGNVYGGGWAQSGAESNVSGNVSISLADATAQVVYGGGAHGTNSQIAGTTSVSGDVNISVVNSVVGSVYAIGQATGDTVDGIANVTIAGESMVDKVFGTDYYGEKASETNLTLNNFNGVISQQISGFDLVTITGATEANFASGISISNENWLFSMRGRTAGETPEEAWTALTWENGSFAAETAGGTVFNLDLGGTASDLVICDLSGDDVKANAFENVIFNVTIYEDSIADYKLGSDLTYGVWAGKQLTYDETKGILAISTIA